MSRSKSLIAVGVVLCLLLAWMIAPGADGAVCAAPDDEHVHASADASEDDSVVIELVAPEIGAIHVVRDPGFHWQAVSGATEYEVALAKDAAFTDVVDSGRTAMTAWSTDKVLDYGTTYFWRVRVAAPVQGEWSVGSFTVVAEPPEPPRPPEPLPPPEVGIKTGDWIKIEYSVTGWPAGQPHFEWLKLEFLEVEEASANVRATMRWSDGDEETETMSVDIGEGGGDAFDFSGFVIPANLTTGDTVYLTEYGKMPIEGETTRTYAGARRPVVHAGVSVFGISLTFYWDKETGVMVESSQTFEDMTLTGTATETNMWGGGLTGMPWWFWVVVAVAIVASASAVYVKRRKTRSGVSP